MIRLKGVSFYQDTIASLDEWSLGSLRLEPDNPYDADACAVDVQGQLVGYLPKGWRHEEWGQDLLAYINNSQGENSVSLKKVGGYDMYDGKKAALGLHLVTVRDILEVGED